MTVESDVADVYALILRKNASEETARAAAMALCRELMPGSDDRNVREVVARAIATVRLNQRGEKNQAPDAGRSPRTNKGRGGR